MSISATTTFNALAAISTNDVWAIGSYVRVGNYNINPLAMHWDGAVWTVSNLAPPADYGQLLGVSAVSATDVWAVGYSGTQTLVEHWDSTAWWVTPSPSVGTDLNILVAVTAISATDVWAVGQQSRGQVQTLSGTLGWHSVVRSIKSQCRYGHRTLLTAVSAISADDIWAVGSLSDGFYIANTGRTLGWYSLVRNTQPQSELSSLT